jgi:hypothetical protein
MVAVGTYSQLIRCMLWFHFFYVTPSRKLAPGGGTIRHVQSRDLRRKIEHISSSQ